MIYKNLSGYFREKYGKRLKKICIDGGFTCPNRDGTVSLGGCIYCGERGAGEHIEPAESIAAQVRRGLLTGGEDSGFVAYFQNFTNTYAEISVLRERYDAALIDERIKVLAIGTRPDCITAEVADLIASYMSRVDVWVELGLQTASDKTARIINRGYPTSVFLQAVRILHSRNIPVVAHMIIGLPGEGEADVMRTVGLINESGVFGVKLHSMYVMEGTALAQMYRRGEYVPPSLDEYAELAARCLLSLRSDIIVHRITGDCPRSLLVAPDWNTDKNRVISEIRRRLGQMQANRENNR